MGERNIVLCGSPRPYSIHPWLTRNQQDFSERHPKADQAVKEEFIASLLRCVWNPWQEICRTHPLISSRSAHKTRAAVVQFQLVTRGMLGRGVVPRVLTGTMQGWMGLHMATRHLNAWPHRINVFVIIRTITFIIKWHSSLLVTQFPD